MNAFVYCIMAVAALYLFLCVYVLMRHDPLNERIWFVLSAVNAWIDAIPWIVPMAVASFYIQPFIDSKPEPYRILVLCLLCSITWFLSDIAKHVKGKGKP